MKIENNKSISRYMNVKQLSEYLQISTSNIYKRTTNGSIPVIKMNKRVIFDKEEIDKWMSSGCDSNLQIPSLKVA
ncbi:helix-turn-helix domain-containing protein [Flavobacterium chungnamense]|uniref:Helix-turn-helix domain-containing protein n=1 Tax=Flavobacterium chungnamense TaxID=706182 RepID=A0ABP7V1Z0_9FLAO